MIVKDSVNVKQFGAKGDGETDDTNAFNKALASCGYVKCERGKTYLVQGEKDGVATGIIIPSHTTLDLNGATLKEIANLSTNSAVVHISNATHACIENGTIVGEADSHGDTTGEWGHGVYVENCDNITIKKLNISNCWGDGITVSGTTDEEHYNTLIKQCRVSSCRRNGISIVVGHYIYIEDCDISGINGTAPQAGIDLESNDINHPVTHIFINNVTINSTVGASLVATTKSDYVNVTNLFCDKDIVSACQHNNFDNITCTIFYARKYAKVNNSNIIQTYMTEGEAYFNNCTITGDDSNVLIRVAKGEILQFTKCHFRNTERTFTNPIQLGNENLKNLIFTACTFELAVTENMVNGYTSEKCIIKDCILHLSGTTGSIVVLNNADFTFANNTVYAESLNIIVSGATFGIAKIINNIFNVTPTYISYDSSTTTSEEHSTVYLINNFFSAAYIAKRFGYATLNSSNNYNVT